MKAYKYSKKLMKQQKILFSGGEGKSKKPVDGIISIFRMVDLIRIIGIAQIAVTCYPYIQLTIIPTLKNEFPLCSCLTRKSDELVTYCKKI
jgi:hypothetical protein